MQSECMNQPANAGVPVSLSIMLDLMIQSPHKFERDCGLRAKQVLRVARRCLYALRDDKGNETFLDVRLSSARRPARIVWQGDNPQGYRKRHGLFSRRLH